MEHRVLAGAAWGFLAWVFFIGIDLIENGTRRATVGREALSFALFVSVGAAIGLVSS